MAELSDDTELRLSCISWKNSPLLDPLAELPDEDDLKESSALDCRKSVLFLKFRQLFSLFEDENKTCLL